MGAQPERAQSPKQCFLTLYSPYNLGHYHIALPSSPTRREHLTHAVQHRIVVSAAALSLAPIMPPRLSTPTTLYQLGLSAQTTRGGVGAGGERGRGDSRGTHAHTRRSERCTCSISRYDSFPPPLPPPSHPPPRLPLQPTAFLSTAVACTPGGGALSTQCDLTTECAGRLPAGSIVLPVRTEIPAWPSRTSDSYSPATEQVEHTQIELEVERDRAVKAQRVRHRSPVPCLEITIHIAPVDTCSP